MIEGILIGIKTALSFQNLLMVMIGCFAGTIIAVSYTHLRAHET